MDALLDDLSHGLQILSATLSELVWERQVQKLMLPCFEQPQLPMSEGRSWKRKGGQERRGSGEEGEGKRKEKEKKR